MLAKATTRLGTETAFEVLAKAKALEAEGRDIVHLEIGEPDFDTPRFIVEAGIQALRDGYTHYGPSSGLPQARAAFAEYAGSMRGIEIDPDTVVVTPGAKPVMFFGMLSLVDPGDEVIYPNPGFPIYESVIEYMGAKAVPLRLSEENRFSFDVEELRSLITPRTKMLILNSPANPTGGVIPKQDIEAVAELARSHDFWVLSDEVYARILYAGEHFSLLSIPGMRERTILLDGHSKTYAMTGWRLGFAVAPKPVADMMTKFMTNCNSCTAGFTQIAGIAAVRGPQDDVAAMVQEFRARRDLVVDGLNAIPRVSCCKPSGAFYVFPNITQTGTRSTELAGRILREAGVATLAGTAFGAYGEGYLRLSYASSQENIRKALSRIGELIEKLP
ncbi:MAG: pyridoxal phosphate-dependent aminotransferase [Candidatus Krumholzibacteriia bacterium]